MNCDPQLADFLRSQLPASLDLLKKMVAINSFTTNRDGVNCLGKFTAESFRDLGFVADYTPSFRKDYGDHLVMTRPGRTTRTIALISHLDTVFPPEEEQRNNFVWREAGERIYGPGIMDIKGGTTMIHLILSALRKVAPEAFEEITWKVILNSSEEVYSKDFGDLCLARLGKETIAALVFESGGRSDKQFLVVTARKGRAVFRITAEGRGAHAGSHHERGINAIVQISDTIQRIAALTNYSKDLTVNIGNISGGTVINRVPHLATAELEMRAFSAEVYRDAVNAIMALNGKGNVKSVEDGQPCEIKIELLTESPPWPRNDATKRLYEVWRDTGRELGLTVLPEERGGLSDGNFICHALPTLDGMGPNGDNAHCSEQSADGTKEQEYVETASILPKATLNTLAILKLIRGG
ncbi:MAG: putative Acetylornithine deacetylase/Succinyl-diaminopimelate desuccinylase [Verrucomicrobiales bacterium]|nr:putative Acetylornithine deacetylase/Succinyl-diaminopimelate desuccinylase [Verrucomicrobiales bacterium]